MHLEPSAGPSARLATAILGSERVRLVAAGQVPRERFIEAGVRAGLSEIEVRDRTGWFHRNVHVGVDVDGMPLRVSSLHARAATGGHQGRPPLAMHGRSFTGCAPTGSLGILDRYRSASTRAPPRSFDPKHWQPSMADDAT